MAADYLAGCSVALEPKAGSARWLVAMTLMGSLVQVAAKTDNPFVQLIQRYNSKNAAPSVVLHDSDILIFMCTRAKYKQSV